MLDELHVHYAATGRSECDAAERAMLRAFAAGVSTSSRAELCTPAPLRPFANLRDGDHQRKQHGISGATGQLPPEC